MLDTLEKIEKLEYKYLMKYYHFLKYVEDEMLYGFRTKEDIKDEWEDYYGNGQSISDFAVGAERIVYSLINGKGIGEPNSAPVGADLFFEVEDAFIHIDLKTVQTDNIGDYTNNIFVGDNQNSYCGEMEVSRRSGKLIRKYEGHLPTRYRRNREGEKICLTYFITILYDRDNLDILVISIMCMPNGELEPIYKSRPLKAGKNPGKLRFDFTSIPYFELLKNKKRVKVVYYNKEMKEQYRKRLKKYFELFVEEHDE